MKTYAQTHTHINVYKQNIKFENKRSLSLLCFIIQFSKVK
jgi:hypothetical protein